MVSLATATQLGSIYFGGFGLTLLAAPGFFYAKGGIMPYFNEAPTSMSEFNGRGFGASLLAMTAAHYFAPGEKNTAKIMAVGTIALWPAVAMNAFGGDPANVEMMWKMQIFAHTAICYILYSAGF